MLLTSLQSSEDASLRQRILIKLAAGKNGITYDSMVEDLINFQTTIAEAKLIERPSAFKNVSALKRGKERDQQQMPSNSRFANNSQMLQRHNGNAGVVQAITGPTIVVTNWKSAQNANFPATSLHNAKVFSNGDANLPESQFNESKSGVSASKTKFVADSGTEVNIIDEDAYDQIGRPQIQKCEEKGQLFDGTKVAFIGKGVATFQFGDIAIDQEFYLAKRGSLNLLSFSTMDAFGLLDELKKKISNSAINLCENTNSSATITSKAAEKFIRELKATFSTTFEEGLGLCTMELAHLQLKDDATPIYIKARPMPHHPKEIVEKELDRLEQLGIIRKAEHLTWAAPIFVVKKGDGSARLCIDYSTGLNHALLDYQHPLPIPDDIFATEWRKIFHPN
ncbi:hypothetical protein niasHS_011941 [Heterodera schachtii]|uniref:Uncharacterized protein n=1 Tax=Heterodera schachtii TaxID=97005 RepID=A0ABD2IUF1_HETSC